MKTKILIPKVDSVPDLGIVGTQPTVLNCTLRTKSQVPPVKVFDESGAVAKENYKKQETRYTN